MLSRGTLYNQNEFYSVLFVTELYNCKSKKKIAKPRKPKIKLNKYAWEVDLFFNSKSIFFLEREWYTDKERERERERERKRERKLEKERGEKSLTEKERY